MMMTGRMMPAAIRRRRTNEYHKWQKDSKYCVVVVAVCVCVFVWGGGGEFFEKKDKKYAEKKQTGPTTVAMERSKTL